MSAVDLHSLGYFAAAETPYTLLCSIKYWFMWHNATGTTHTSFHLPSSFFSAAILCFPSRQCAWWSTPGMLISSLETEAQGSWHQSQQGLFTVTLSQKRERLWRNERKEKMVDQTWPTPLKKTDAPSPAATNGRSYIQELCGQQKSNLMGF